MARPKKEEEKEVAEKIANDVAGIEDKVIAPQVRPYEMPKGSSNVPKAIIQENAAFLSSLKRIKVTQDELKKLQDEKKLVGYDPATQEAIIK